MSEKFPEFDANGDPTDHTLQLITDWPYDDLPAMIGFARRCFNDHYGKWEIKRMVDTDIREDIPKALRIVTGGWSTNESVVQAMLQNRIFDALCWVLSARGGLHVFDLGRINFPNEHPSTKRGTGSSAGPAAS